MTPAEEPIQLFSCSTVHKTPGRPALLPCASKLGNWHVEQVMALQYPSAWVCVAQGLELPADSLHAVHHSTAAAAAPSIAVASTYWCPVSLKHTQLQELPQPSLCRTIRRNMNACETNQAHSPRMMTEVVPSPTSSSCVRLSWIMDCKHTNTQAHMINCDDVLG